MKFVKLTIFFTLLTILCLVSVTNTFEALSVPHKKMKKDVTKAVQKKHDTKKRQRRNRTGPTKPVAATAPNSDKKKPAVENNTSVALTSTTKPTPSTGSKQRSNRRRHNRVDAKTQTPVVNPTKSNNTTPNLNHKKHKKRNNRHDVNSTDELIKIHQHFVDIKRQSEGIIKDDEQPEVQTSSRNTHVNTNTVNSPNNPATMSFSRRLRHR
jgi:hypothetical protein